MAVKRIIGGLVATLAVIGLIIIGLTVVPGSEYRTFASPDGRFKVVVYCSRQWLGAMPGQAGDAPGHVCLYEVTTGNLLERKPVEMVQLVEQVTWSATNVDIKFIAEWNLP